MKIEIEFSQNDRDLESYFSVIEEPARPWVMKQLVKLGIQSGINPYVTVSQQKKSIVIQEPDFEHTMKPQNKSLRENMPVPRTKTRELSLEEKKNKLRERMKL